MDYKQLYTSARGWYIPTATTHIVYETTTTNVIRLLMKAHTITLTGANTVVISATPTIVTIHYGNKHTTIRLIDALYIIDRLLHHKYTLQQTMPTLSTVPADIQRKIFVESHTITKAQRITKTTKAATLQQMQELCNQPITFLEVLKYILAEEPQYFVLGTIGADKYANMRLDTTLYKLSTSATKQPKVGRKLLQEYKTYGVTVERVPNYSCLDLKLYCDARTHHFMYTIKKNTSTDSYTDKIVGDILYHAREQGDIYIDIYSAKRIYNRRISCMTVDKDYATTQVDSVFGGLQHKLVNIDDPNINSLILYAMHLFPNLYLLNPNEDLVVELEEAIEDEEKLPDLIREWHNTMMEAI